MLTHLSLFTGIGGLDLAAEAAGFTTVGQCEWAAYPTKILEKHWPDVPRWRDIRTLTKESFHEQAGIRTVDLISGGFPCQPFSVAGKRRGAEDDRYLWPEMLRVITELRPAWVVGENVAGIVTMALDQVLSDLEGIGYSCQTFIIPACAVDAPHRRDRCAIVAYTDRERELQPSGEQKKCRYWAFDSGYDVSNTHCFRLEEQSVQGLQKEPKVPITDCGWWPVEPDVGRVAHGVPNRVDRLKCLGNAVVPQQFYPIFKAIAEVKNLHSGTD